MGGVTEAELLAALEEAFNSVDMGPEDAFTAPELAERTGKHHVRIQKALKPLLASGKWEMVKVRRVAIDGRLAKVAGYRPRKAA